MFEKALNMAANQIDNAILERKLSSSMPPKVKWVNSAGRPNVTTEVDYENSEILSYLHALNQRRGSNVVM